MTDISEEGDDPWFVFEQESVEEYCRHFGLTIWPDTHAQRCTIIQTLPASITPRAD